MNNRTCCYATCQLSIGLESMFICIPFLDWWSVQALFCTGHNQKEQTGSQDISLHQLRLWGWPAPMSWECLFNKRFVCLSCNWAVTPLVLSPLIDCYNFLLWWDKNQGRGINQLDRHKTTKGGGQHILFGYRILYFHVLQWCSLKGDSCCNCLEILYSGYTSCSSWLLLCLLREGRPQFSGIELWAPLT